MALPKRKDTKSFLPIIKFDARRGTFTRVDRMQDDVGEWKTETHEIPEDDFEAIADLANLQIGWVSFDSKTPDFRMFDLDQDIGEPRSAKPKRTEDSHPETCCRALSRLRARA
jgi:hypothetical protein